MEQTMERPMAGGQVRRLVLTALMIALGYAATLLVQIPSPTNGYLNLGDAVVLLGAYLLGPVYGAAAGGLGPALADLLSGYAVYVPGTLVIKGLMAVTAALLYRALGRRPWATLVCGGAAEAIMVTGYWLYDGLLAAFGGGSVSLALAASAAGIPSNLVQAAFGIAVSVPLAAALGRSGYVRSRFPHL